MAEHGIPFRPEMILALLAGRKTQTRRILKPQPFSVGGFWKWNLPDGASGYPEDVFREKIGRWHPLPYAVGDRLWVREAWRTEKDYDSQSPSQIMAVFNPPLDLPNVRYEADGGHQLLGFPALMRMGRYRHARFMPRALSRMTLIVTDVSIQRLQEISEADVMAEGIERLKSGRGYYDPTKGHGAVRFHYFQTAAAAYAALWDHINGPDSWAENPWVAAVSFEVTHTKPGA